MSLLPECHVDASRPHCTSTDSRTMNLLSSIPELVTPVTAGRRLTRLSAFTLWRFFYGQYLWIPPRQPILNTPHTPLADAPSPATYTPLL